MVLGEAMTMLGAGLTLGAVVAFWARNLAASLLPDVPVRSIAPIAFAVLAMIVFALFAAFMPARLAARVEPMEALRHE